MNATIEAVAVGLGAMIVMPCIVLGALAWVFI